MVTRKKNFHIVYLCLYIHTYIHIYIYIYIYIYITSILKNLLTLITFKKRNISGHSPFLRLTCCPQQESLYIFTAVICMLQVFHIKARRDKTIHFFHPKAFPFRRVFLVRDIYYLNFQILQSQMAFFKYLNFRPCHPPQVYLMVRL